MKIRYFKLTNFAGIKYGINSDVLELKDIPSGIIVLSGDNGCGKSTTLKTLHVFSDDKEFLIKKDDDTFEPAEKEMIVEYDGNEYHIIHQYNVKGSKKSFISKNGEELNANGNVSTFEDVILKEFGFENNTISNSVIGVSEQNFIDLTSAKRKEEISTLLPNIDVYEKAFKYVNENTNVMKKQIDLNSKRIAESGGSLTINENLSLLNEKIKPMEEVVEKLKEQDIEYGKSLAVIENKITMNQTEIDDVSNKLKEHESRYYDSKAIVEKLNRNITENTETDLQVINGKQEVANNVYNKLLEEKKEIQNRINMMNHEWSNYMKDIQFNNQISQNMQIFQNNIDNTALEIKAIQDELSKVSNINVKPYYTQEMSELISNVGISIKNEVAELKNVYTISIEDKSEFDLYENLNDLSNKKILYEKQQLELENLKSKIDMFENMNQKVSTNTESNIQMSDGCSLSKCALQYKSLIETLKQQYQAKFEFLHKNKEKYEQYCMFINVGNIYSSTYKQRDQLFNILGIDGTNHLRRNDEILSILRSFKKEIDGMLVLMRNQPEIQNRLSLKEEQLAKYKTELSNIKLIDIKEPNFKLDDIKALEDSLKAKDAEIQNAYKKINAIKEEIAIAIEYSKLESYKVFIDKYDDGLKKKESLLNSYNELQNEKNILLSTINTNRSLIKNNLENIDSVKTEIKSLEDKLIVINEYISNKEALERDLEIRKLVLDALNIKTGIPSYLVKSYLIKIEKVCNAIFDQAFNGNYQIYLENLEKDFLVKIYEASTDRIIYDVRLSSSGQQAIVKLVLSIGLAKISAANKAIYLRLDEVDSVLSKANIQLIETLLNSLLDKFGIEQVFIVTHNSSVSVQDLQVYYDRSEMKYEIIKNR